MLLWNCLSTDGKRVRHWMCVVPKSLYCDCGCKGRCTIDAMLQLLVWCLRCLFMGRYPNRRHDGADWLRSDKSRAKMGARGHSFGFHAILMQIRGDWQVYKQVFGFSGWASKNICWLCGATQADGDAPYTDVSLRAKWRTCRYEMSQIFAILRASGVALCPLFSAPGVVMLCITID